MHFPIFYVFCNPISVLSLFSLSLDNNASLNFNEKAELCSRGSSMMKEKTPSALRSVTYQLQSFSETKWIGFKARMIAASATHFTSLKGLFNL